MTRSFWQVQEYFKQRMEEEMKCPKCFKEEAYQGKVYARCDSCGYQWIQIPRIVKQENICTTCGEDSEPNSPCQECLDNEKWKDHTF